MRPQNPTEPFTQYFLLTVWKEHFLYIWSEFYYFIDLYILQEGS